MQNTCISNTPIGLCYVRFNYFSLFVGGRLIQIVFLYISSCILKINKGIILAPGLLSGIHYITIFILKISILYSLLLLVLMHQMNFVLIV